MTYNPEDIANSMDVEQGSPESTPSPVEPQAVAQPTDAAPERPVDITKDGIENVPIGDLKAIARAYFGDKDLDNDDSDEYRAIRALIEIVYRDGYGMGSLPPGD